MFRILFMTSSGVSLWSMFKTVIFGSSLSSPMSNILTNIWKYWEYNMYVILSIYTLIFSRISGWSSCLDLTLFIHSDSFKVSPTKWTSSPNTALNITLWMMRWKLFILPDRIPDVSTESNICNDPVPSNSCLLFFYVLTQRCVKFF